MKDIKISVSRTALSNENIAKKIESLKKSNVHGTIVFTDSFDAPIVF